MNFRSEFKIHNIQLRHDTIGDFLNLKICNVSKNLWVIRLVFFLYTFIGIIYSISTISNVGKWFTFLTNWGGIIVSIYFLLGLFVGFYEGRKSHNDCDQHQIELSTPHGDVTFRELSSVSILPLNIKIFWLFAYFSYVLNGLIVLLYWGFVHKERFLGTLERRFLVINFHGITYILVMIDFFLNDIPIRVFHVVYVIGLSLTYAIFSAIYTSISGRWIYPVLKWDTEPGKATVFCLIALVILIIFHMVVYCFFRLKNKYRKRRI